VHDVEKGSITYATGKHVALLEGILEFFHTYAFGIQYIFRGTSGEQAREFAIEFNQILGDTSSL